MYAVTAYIVLGVILGEKTILDVVNDIVPINTLMEIATKLQTLNVYSSSSTISNPYPPHSAQGAWWNRTNFYYIIGN
ncbi:MAG: hypothetical protein RRZ84_08710 [Romboutsia sp.]